LPEEGIFTREQQLCDASKVENRGGKKLLTIFFTKVVQIGERNMAAGGSGGRGEASFLQRAAGEGRGGTQVCSN